MRRSSILLLALIILSGISQAGIPGISGKQKAMQTLASLSKDIEVEPHMIIVKFERAVRHKLTKNTANIAGLSPVYAKYGVYDIQQMYPNHGDAFTTDGREIGLERMYRISFTSNVDPISVAMEFAALNGVEYAEPERIHRPCFVPNDPRLSQQYALDRMKVKDAWDITKGSRDVVIAIVDSGVHWTHEDLYQNIWVNPGEDINKDGKYTVADINGVDDDGNGYVDDIIGIDFVGPNYNQGPTYYDIDPQPTPTGRDHGTLVSGIAAAVGDNGKGIAGVAYNCRILPVKCMPDAGATTLRRAFDGIVYAADMGARVINCSWGSPGGYLQSEMDRIDYANSKGAVVVAATGNDAKEGIFTPASYPNVLSVTSTTSSDNISSFSNYGTWVDVAAPGSNIHSTVSASNSSYQSQSGTSAASPNVAGVVGLVASLRPELSPRQLAEQVRVTCDVIDDKIPSRYKKKIGYGRVNALRALTINGPAVQMIEYILTDKNTGNDNEIFERGETLELTIRWKNFLAPTANAVVKLSSPNPRVIIQNPDFTLGVLGTLAEAGNEGNPFILQLKDEEALNDQVDIEFTITDDQYSDYGGLFFLQQPTYRNHDVNDITTTVTNDGNVGFDDFSLLRGKGFIYKNNGYNVLFEGAMMIGAKLNGTPLVVDVARDESGSNQLSDFFGTQPVLMMTPGPIAAQEGFTEFTDERAPLAYRLGLKVKLHSFEFTEPDAANIVILKYTIFNTSSNQLDDLYAGLYFDWDISTNGSNDYGEYDTTLQTGFAYAQTGAVPTVVGMTGLTRDKPVTFCNINNPDSDNNPPIFGVHNGYTKDEKYRSLSYGILQRKTGITDISQVIGNGPFTLKPNDSCVVAFALMAGFTSNEIKATTPKALALWDRINKPLSVERMGSPNTFDMLRIAPNPVFQTGTLHYELQARGHVTITLYDMLGRLVTTLVDRQSAPGRFVEPVRFGDLIPGTYLLQMRADGRRVTTTMTVSN